LIATVVPARISGVTGVTEFVSVLCVSVVTVGRVFLDPPVSVGVCSEGLINLKSSPVVFVTVSVSQQGSVVVELDVAPAASASVALSVPVDSDVSVASGSELSVVDMLNIEVSVGVGLLEDSVDALSHPSASAVSDVALTSEDGWHEFDFWSQRLRSSSSSWCVRETTNIVHLVVVVMLGSSMSAVSWSLSPDVDVPAVVSGSWELNINELISPHMVVVTVDLPHGSLDVDSGVAPSPSVGVAHVVPVKSEITILLGSPETVVVVLSGEVLVGVSPEPDSS